MKQLLFCLALSFSSAIVLCQQLGFSSFTSIGSSNIPDDHTLHINLGDSFNSTYDSYNLKHSEGVFNYNSTISTPDLDIMMETVGLTFKFFIN